MIKSLVTKITVVAVCANSVLAVESISAIITPATAATIINPGFETGDLTPWFQDRDGSDSDAGPVEAWNVTSADAHTGIYSATNTNNLEIRQNFSPVAARDITELSFWLRQPEPAISAVSLFYSDNSESQEVVSLSSSDWEFFDITPRLEGEKDLIGFSVFGYARSGPEEDRTFLDDVTLKVQPIPEPSSLLSTLAFTTLGGGLLMKRKLQKQKPVKPET